MRAKKIVDENELNKRRIRGNRRNTVLLIALITLVSGMGVFAWFSVSNRARVENLSMIADHQGNLRIAEDKGNGPGSYSDSIVLDTKNKDIILSPVTSKDGVEFYSPSYDTSSKSVTSATKITSDSDLTKYYIYKTTFYLRAGVDSDNKVAKIKRTYDIALYGLQSNNKDEGCYIYQSDSKKETAANCVRISFTLDDGSTYVYEPNSDAHNTDTNRASNGLDNSYGSFKNLYQQKSSGPFVKSPKTNESEKMFNIEEDKDVKVTMRVWIEGTDDDCTNSIASDMIYGQIQFISSEIKQ